MKEGDIINFDKPIGAAPYSGVPLPHICPSDKAERGVLMNFKEASEFSGVCEFGSNQLIKCYGDISGDNVWYNLFDFLARCSGCPYYIGRGSKRNGYKINSIFEPAFIETECGKDIEFDNPKSYVYFVSDSRAIKIGKAVNPDKRLLELQTGNPNALKILYLIPCKTQKSAHDIESFLHRVYKMFKMEGEWFDLIGRIHDDSFKIYFGAEYFDERRKKNDG